MHFLAVYFQYREILKNTANSVCFKVFHEGATRSTYTPVSLRKMDVLLVIRRSWLAVSQLGTRGVI